MRATYSNCFGPVDGLLLTEEPSVAAATPGAMIVDRMIDPDLAERVNKAVWQLAFNWATIGGPDVTVVDGVSAADLGGLEAAIGVLIPAARGALGVMAAIDRGVALTSLTVNVPETQRRVYGRTERMQSAGAVAAALMRCGDHLPIDSLVIGDQRNAALEAKYARVRDVDPLSDDETLPARTLRTAAFAGTNLLGAARRRGRTGSILVYEYNPTRAFADAYGSRDEREWRQVRHCPPAAVLTTIARNGDRCSSPLPRDDRPPDAAFVNRLTAMCQERRDALEDAFTVAGVSLWPRVGRELIDISGRYARFAKVAVPAAVRRLERYEIDAVLVPFDTPPEARMLVRAAQRVGVPTFVINDGWKGDDFTVEGMTVDTALAWSTSIASRYFSRRTHGSTIVTGNPKSEGIRRPTKPRPTGPVKRILVGTFTFSPSDINCRRSDSECFLAEVLEGIAALGPSAVDGVTIKLHPADAPAHYTGLLAAYETLPIRLVTTGDVVDLFEGHDLYVTTYSSSLLEAAHVGMPFVYYRVNEQRFHPPFTHDSVLGDRTAANPSSLAALLRNPATCEAVPSRDDWLATYLGVNDGGAVNRIVDAIGSGIRAAATQAPSPRDGRATRHGAR